MKVIDSADGAETPEKYQLSFDRQLDKLKQKGEHCTVSDHCSYKRYNNISVQLKQQLRKIKAAAIAAGIEAPAAATHRRNSFER